MFTDCLKSPKFFCMQQRKRQQSLKGDSKCFFKLATSNLSLKGALNIMLFENLDPPSYVNTLEV